MSSEEELKRQIAELQEDKISLQILLDNNAEHASSLEEQLSIQIKSIEKLRDRLKVYLSPQLYDSIIHKIESDSPNLENPLQQSHSTQVKQHQSFKRKKLVVFFSDIVGFTALTDSVESEQLYEILNTYLDRMSVIALKYGGTVDKFIGDAVMIFFGDPLFTDDETHAINCVKMALEMQDQLVLLNDHWHRKLGLTHPIEIRMGINIGYCTVGDFGSKNRMDYTVVGGDVNIASRLESLAHPGQIFISLGIYMLVKDIVECWYVDDIKVKGVHYPIQVYQALKLKQDHTPVANVFQKTENGFVLNQMSYDGQNMGIDELERTKASLCESVRFIEKALEEKKEQLKQTNLVE